MSPSLDPRSVADAIRRYYYAARERCTGRRVRTGGRHDTPETWGKAASACIAAGADPYDWVDAAFANCGHRSGPFANMLSGASAARWYRLQYGTGRGTTTLAEVTPYQVDDIKATLITAHTMMLNRTGSARTYHPENRKFLAACYFPFEPWVRVTIACCRDQLYGEVLDEYGEAARLFFSEHPRHVSILTDLGYDMGRILNLPAAPCRPASSSHSHPLL